MTTELLSQIWQGNQTTVLGPIHKLTPDNYRNRLTPETASAGFIALHTAEVMHRFAKLIFGRDLTIQPQTVGGVKDDGKPLDLDFIQGMVTDSFAMIAEQIEQTNDDQWSEMITMHFGEVPRLQGLVFLMHHNSYHAGQIAQAMKKGNEFSVSV